MTGITLHTDTSCILTPAFSSHDNAIWSGRTRRRCAPRLSTVTSLTKPPDDPSRAHARLTASATRSSASDCDKSGLQNMKTRQRSAVGNHFASKLQSRMWSPCMAMTPPEGSVQMTPEVRAATAIRRPLQLFNERPADWAPKHLPALFSIPTGHNHCTDQLLVLIINLQNSPCYVRVKILGCTSTDGIQLAG